MTVFYNILDISALANQIIICSQLKKYEEKRFSISQTAYFSSTKVSKNYCGIPKVKSEEAFRQLYIGNVSVRLTAQLLRFELGLFSSITWYEFETCIRGNKYQVKLIDCTIKLVSPLITY